LDRLNETIKPSALGHHIQFRPLVRPCAAGAGEPRMPETRTIRNTSPLPESCFEPLRSESLAPMQISDWHSRIQSREFLRDVFPAAPRAARSREFQILRQPIQIGVRRESLRIAPAGPSATSQVRRAVQSVASHKGLTPRVSMGVRFRPPVVRNWQFKGSSVSRPHLVWIEMPQSPAVRDNAAAPQLQSAQAGSRPAVPRPLPHRVPMPFGSPAMRPISARMASGTAEPHEAAMPLGRQEAARPTLRIAPRRDEHRRSFARLIQSPLSIHAAHRITGVRFTAQDFIVSSPVEEFQTK
jgi:hypothetical protein